MTDDRVPGLQGSRLQGRPLLDTRPDMDMYLARSVEAPLRDSLRRGLNILLEGKRGSGKTTLLQRLMWENRHATNPGGRDLTLVRAGRAESPGIFLAMVLATLTMHEPLVAMTDGSDAVAQLSNPSAVTVEDQNSPLAATAAWAELTTTQTALDALRRHVAEQPLPVVVLVDDVAPTLGHQLFGVLRDDLWSLGLQWVVTVNEESADTLLTPPADAFFDRRIKIDALEAADAAALLRLRLGHDVSVPLGQWQPRDLLQLARSTDPADWTDEAARRARQQVEISKLGRPASMLAEVLDKLGPVSASDPRVAAEVGWTRARVSQVLRQLLDAGWVTYTETPSGKPGRPSRIYRLTYPGPVETT